jgi:flagellar assembly protein FliH
MSLSDKDNNNFEPMALSSLESYDEEQLKKTDKITPDLKRFEMLFEKDVFRKEETYEFQAVYDPEKDVEEIVFKPLIEREDDPFGDDAKADKSPGDNSEEIEQVPEEPLETPEEIGYREGFEKGMEQGLEQGEKKGFEEGLIKGETSGFEKGEKEGDIKGHEQGFERGLKEGEEKGETETREKGTEILNSLEHSLKTADQTLDLLVEKYEERIISLIQKIAQKAVLARVEVDDEIVKHMILDSLKHLVAPEEINLSVSSEDYEYIEMVKDEFFEKIDSLTSISVSSDPSIKRGGCKIATNTASISTDVESRLETIFEAFKTQGA